MISRNLNKDRFRRNLKNALKDISLDEKKVGFILILILMLSFLLRIHKLSAESLWFDEASSVANSKRSVIEIIASQGVHPPLYHIILHFWMILFGDSEFSIRFLSVIFGVASIYVIYHFGNLIFNKDIGVISAFILSISLFHIRYSQEVRFYSLLALLVLLSNYYFVKIMKEKNIKHTVAYVIFTTIMIYTHIFGVFYIIIHNIYYLLIYRKNTKFWFVVQGAVLLLFIPWITVLLKQIIKIVETGGSVAWIPRPTLLTLNNTFKLFAGSEMNLYIFTILFIAGLITSRFYKQFYMDEFNDRIFLLLWLFFPILTSFTISLIYKPIYYYKYLIGSLPALILLVSKGILNFRKSLTILILIMVLIVFAISSVKQYYEVIEKEQWREVANYIENNKRDSDFVLLYVNYMQIPFKYYYKNDSNFAGIYGAYQIEHFTEGHEEIWLILSHYWSSEMKNESKLIEKILSNMYVKQNIIYFKDIKLIHYSIYKYYAGQIQPNQSKIIYLTDSNTKIAQSFIPEREELDAVQLRAAKPSDEIKVYIQTDNENSPSGNTIGNIVTTKPHIYTNFTVEVGRIKMELDKKYWIIIERTKGNISLYGEGANNNKVIKIYNSTKNIWQDSWNWGNSSGNGLYFKTLILNRTNDIEDLH